MIFFWSAHAQLWGTDYGHPTRAFFKYPKYIGWLVRSAEYVARYFRVFWLGLSAQILSLYIPSPWFCITQPLFLQKAKIFIHFTGFSIWDWAVDSLRSSHHVSLVRGRGACQLCFLYVVTWILVLSSSSFLSDLRDTMPWDFFVAIKYLHFFTLEGVLVLPVVNWVI